MAQSYTLLWARKEDRSALFSLTFVWMAFVQAWYFNLIYTSKTADSLYLYNSYVFTTNTYIVYYQYIVHLYFFVECLLVFICNFI